MTSQLYRLYYVFSLLIAIASVDINTALIEIGPGSNSNIALENHAGGFTVTANDHATYLNLLTLYIEQNKQGSFLLPDQCSTLILNINAQALTQIYGTLFSNGRVIMINPSGLIVGEHGVIDTAQFTFSTLPIHNLDAFKEGKLLNESATGKVCIKGTIRAPEGVFIFSNHIEKSETSGSGKVTLANKEAILFQPEENSDFYLTCDWKKFAETHSGDSLVEAAYRCVAHMNQQDTDCMLQLKTCHDVNILDVYPSLIEITTTGDVTCEDNSLIHSENVYLKARKIQLQAKDIDLTSSYLEAPTIILKGVDTALQIAHSQLIGNSMDITSEDKITLSETHITSDCFLLTGDRAYLRSCRIQDATSAAEHNESSFSSAPQACLSTINIKAARCHIQNSELTSDVITGSSSSPPIETANPRIQNELEIIDSKITGREKVEWNYPTINRTDLSEIAVTQSMIRSSLIHLVADNININGSTPTLLDVSRSIGKKKISIQASKTIYLAENASLLAYGSDREHGGAIDLTAKSLHLHGKVNVTGGENGGSGGSVKLLCDYFHGNNHGMSHILRAGSSQNNPGTLTRGPYSDSSTHVGSKSPHTRSAYILTDFIKSESKKGPLILDSPNGLTFDSDSPLIYDSPYSLNFVSNDMEVLAPIINQGKGNLEFQAQNLLIYSETNDSAGLKTQRDITLNVAHVNLVAENSTAFIKASQGTLTATGTFSASANNGTATIDAPNIKVIGTMETQSMGVGEVIISNPVQLTIAAKNIYAQGQSTFSCPGPIALKSEQNIALKSSSGDLFVTGKVLTIRANNRVLLDRARTAAVHSVEIAADQINILNDSKVTANQGDVFFKATNDIMLDKASQALAKSGKIRIDAGRHFSCLDSASLISMGEGGIRIRAGLKNTAGGVRLDFDTNLNAAHLPIHIETNKHNDIQGIINGFRAPKSTQDINTPYQIFCEIPEDVYSDTIYPFKILYRHPGQVELPEATVTSAAFDRIFITFAGPFTAELFRNLHPYDAFTQDAIAFTIQFSSNPTQYYEIKRPTFP
ncbi:MAG: filamentous hemagglutinin N-terminal domain-containing protein [Chlamydiota bacterium]